MVLRSPGLADAIAAEWARQGETFELEHALHLTRLAYAAIDSDRADIVAHIMKVAGTDLTCYRADAPAELVRRQDAAWDVPMLWVQSRIGAAFHKTTGVAFVPQPPETLRALEHALSARDLYALPVLSGPQHAATGILGSAVLALNLEGARLDAVSAFAAAHVDEAFQAEKWGEDREARKRLDGLAAELASVEQFLRLL